MTPLYKKLKTNGTSFYAFPGSSEDINAFYQNQNYKVYFTKYVLLNLPKQNLVAGSTASNPIKFDFENSFKTSTNATPASTYGDQLVESLRNYVANFEVTMKGSRLNNTEYYYDSNAIETDTEKIFWRWCKKLNLMSFEPANPGDEYFDTLIEFERNNLTDDSYFPEVIWKERETTQFSIYDYYESGISGFTQNLIIEFNTTTNFRVGDKVTISSETNTNVGSGAIWYADASPVSLSGANLNVVGVIAATSTTKQKVIFDVYTNLSSSAGTYTGKANLVYSRLVQYIGEVNGVNNVKEANSSYTSIYAHIPAHTGQTPDILFRTKTDVNYKPNLIFPILPSQIQPEIVGAEIFTNPIVNTPQNYPGGYYGQFDTEYFNYEVASGDSIRRSGDYYGIDGDINTPIVNGDTIDGIIIDFDPSHYVKMNIIGRELTNFDQFNALEVNNQPPSDFEFNSILWYYTVVDNNGNSTNNLYGVSFLDNPDNNPVTSEIGLRIPLFKKLAANDNQDGSSYAFSINLVYEITNDNTQDAYNPEAINSLFGFNLFNEAMRKLSLTNQSFLKIITDHSDVLKQVSDLRQLLYTQTDLALINKKISNLENLLKLYQTNQISSTESIKVTYNNSNNPPSIELSALDPSYDKIDNIKTTHLYTSTGIIPMNISVPVNKNFLLHVTNDDFTKLTLPNADKLTIVLDRDLDYKQSFDFIVDSTDISTENKQIDIYIKHSAGVPTNIPVETRLFNTMDLPVYYNSVQQTTNTAKNWDMFKFNIDENKDLRLNTGSILEVPLTSNSNLVKNSIKSGDSLVLDGFLVGTSSQINFSGQYKVDAIGSTNSYIYLDVSNNDQLISYGLSASLPLTFNSSTDYILSNMPFITLNKGYKYRVTRVLQDSEIDNTLSTSTINQMYLIEKL